MPLVLTVVLVGGVIVGVAILSQVRLTVTRIRRMSQASFVLLLFVAGYSLWSVLPQLAPVSPGFWIVLALWGCALAAVGYSAWFRCPNDREIATKYGEDQVHCPRCGYDLTGNVSGRCSECGWEIPRSDHVWEKPSWPHWWKQWEIEYLHDWRKSLAGSLVVTALFAVLGVVVLALFGVLGAPLTAGLSLVVANGIINVVRILQYRRRQRLETR
jgi:Kef-type K+ transport system membrane component KefB